MMLKCFNAHVFLLTFMTLSSLIIAQIDKFPDCAQGQFPLPQDLDEMDIDPTQCDHRVKNATGCLLHISWQYRMVTRRCDYDKCEIAGGSTACINDTQRAVMTCCCFGDGCDFHL
uniref:Activin_recp domain-containing protein n=1 Tax=Panagrellus redivivus TaxID=6233 RepID=A0A7E5A0C4_PANRE